MLQYESAVLRVNAAPPLLRPESSGRTQFGFVTDSQILNMNAKCRSHVQ